MPENTSRQVKAILWDNDGILVDTERMYYEVTRSVLAENGADLDEASYRQHFMKANVGAWHLLSEKGVSKEEIERLRALRNARYVERLQGADVVMDAVEDVLKSLYGKIRMAVVTSSRRLPFETIHERTGLMKYFEFALVREDYGSSKPDPEPYVTAVEKLGLRPDDCLVIEDTERGLRAAVAAGIRCWVIPHGISRGSDFGQAERILTSIRDVPRLLLEGGQISTSVPDSMLL